MSKVQYLNIVLGLVLRIYHHFYVNYNSFILKLKFLYLKAFPSILKVECYLFGLVRLKLSACCLSQNTLIFHLLHISSCWVKMRLFTKNIFSWKFHNWNFVLELYASAQMVACACLQTQMKLKFCMQLLTFSFHFLL